MINPLDFRDYKVYLRAYIADQPEPRGIVSALADAAGCNRSYFSQVLNSHVHLTPDQAFAFAQLTKLTKSKQKYFCLLVDHARAATKKLRERIEEDMDEIVHEEETLETRYKMKRIEPGERELFYYSSWINVALHVLTSVPEFQTAEALADRIGLPLAQVVQSLEQLARYEFVRHKGKRWIILEGSLHLPRRSLLNSVNHANWRNQAVLDSQKFETQAVHYTSVASMGHEDFKKLKAMLLQFVDQSRAIVTAAKEEDVYCTTVDLFRI